MKRKIYVVHEASEVTQEVLDLAAVAVQRCTPEGKSIRWDAAWGEMDGETLPSGSVLILSSDQRAPAFAVIKEHVWKLRGKGQI